MSWRTWTDRIKRAPALLRLADRIDRIRGGLRLFDNLSSPSPAPLKPDLADWANHDLAAIWIGHATVLLRLGGMTILTDPVFSNRVGPGLGLVTIGPKRRQAPALALKDLPPIDVILLSHSHFDHLDRTTLAQIDRHIPLITAKSMDDLVHDLGFRNVTSLHWGESHTIGNIKFTAREVNHWGARIFVDTYRGYNGFLMQAGNDRVLYAGDTAYTNVFRGMGGLDLAIFGIGGYDPYIQAHATPEQAWEMVNHTGAKRMLPIHHTTFRLSHEPIEDPMKRLLAAAGAQADRIVVKQVGGQWVRKGRE